MWACGFEAKGLSKMHKKLECLCEHKHTLLEKANNWPIFNTIFFCNEGRSISKTGASKTILKKDESFLQVLCLQMLRRWKCNIWNNALLVIFPFPMYESWIQLGSNPRKLINYQYTVLRERECISIHSFAPGNLYMRRRKAKTYRRKPLGISYFMCTVCRKKVKKIITLGGVVGCIAGRH